MRPAFTVIVLISVICVAQSANALDARRFASRKLLGAQGTDQFLDVSVGFPGLSVTVGTQPDLSTRSGNSGPDSWQWGGGNSGCNRVWQNCGGGGWPPNSPPGWPNNGGGFPGNNGWRNGWRNNPWGWNRRRA